MEFLGAYVPVVLARFEEWRITNYSIEPVFFKYNTLKKDILEIKEDYIKDMQFHYVSEMSEVIDLALLKSKVKKAKDINRFNTEPAKEK